MTINVPEEGESSGFVDSVRQFVSEVAVHMPMLAAGAIQWTDLVSAVGPPVVAESIRQLEVKAFRRRAVSMVEVVDQASKHMGCAPEEVLARADEPRKELFAEEALLAGAGTVTTSKIHALGRVLAKGLEASDEVLLDEMSQILHALAEMEEQHIALLAFFGNRVAPEAMGSDSNWDIAIWYSPKASMRDLVEQFPQLRVGLTGLVAVLERHGLIANNPRTEDRQRRQRLDALGSRRAAGSGYVSTRVTNIWAITPLGYAVATYLLDTSARGVDPLDVVP